MASPINKILIRKEGQEHATWAFLCLKQSDINQTQVYIHELMITQTENSHVSLRMLYYMKIKVRWWNAAL